jgi:hypothetical protein
MQNPKVRKVYFNNCAVLVNSIVSYWRVIEYRYSSVLALFES